MIDFQSAFNIAAGIAGGLFGWMLNNLFVSMRDLSRADGDLAAKVSSIEVLVAGQYVRRDEFTAKIDAVFDKLESIDEKLERRLAGYRGQQ